MGGGGGRGTAVITSGSMIQLCVGTLLDAIRYTINRVASSRNSRASYSLRNVLLYMPEEPTTSYFPMY